jgi:16S rRNA (adenine1518-N6/adenine1519-N6)-dimethyltransferase
VSIDSPASLLRRFGLRAKKSWGQNFLSDPNLLSRIAAAVEARPGDTVLEFGAGLGHLTVHLLDLGMRVVAVERDRDLAGILRETLGDRERLTIVEANASTLSIREVAGGPARVVGNLPYHLSSPILFHTLAQRADVPRMVFTFQAEFVDRLVAPPGSRTYGALSVRAQALAEVDRLLDLPAGAFHPRPAVDSIAVALTPLAVPRFGTLDEAFFGKVVQGAFGQRRKTLANALLGAGLADARAALEAADIAPTRRAETVSVPEFVALAEAFREISGATLPGPGTRSSSDTA